MKHFLKGFIHAGNGFKSAVSTTINLRFELTVLFYTFCFAPFFMQNKTQWVTLIIIAFLVIAAEVFNTALENACDAITKEQSHYIKLAKDMSAAAVLILSVCSVIVACFLFLHKQGFYDLYEFCVSHIWFPSALVLLVIPSYFFINRRKK